MILDFWGDNLVHAAVFSCIGIGWCLNSQSTWPLVVTAIAVAGTMWTAWIVYRQTLRWNRSSAPAFTSVVRSKNVHSISHNGRDGKPRFHLSRASAVSHRKSVLVSTADCGWKSHIFTGLASPGTERLNAIAKRTLIDIPTYLAHPSRIRNLLGLG